MVICGEDPKFLIDPVSSEQIVEAVTGYLREWWLDILDTTDRLSDSDYRAYAVLSMCRAQYTLKFGQIASKRQSAEWLISEQPEWHDLVTQALAWRVGESGIDTDRTRELVSATISIAGIQRS